MARWLNVSPSVVYRLWQQFLTTDSAFRRFSQGRPTAMTSADDRYLSLNARTNKTATPTQLDLYLGAATKSERDAYGAGGVCVWGGICLGGCTDLHVFPRGTVNAQTYRDDILDAYVRRYAGAIGDDFLLQDDNARPHRPRIVDDYLQQETIQRMESPARSPDLNPIEHVWDNLGRRIAALNPPPQTLATLATALQEQWLSLPTELIDRIIDSITHRCMCCIASRGDHTP
ncbi:hypothetical protein AVEN_83981-1 [Araneus ventricosus]|uniref:Tc1-like transposase DDE domain-containing protein n=1 Tax=Araneus ventricosus TaxID=182803 RepID=A0A4Y2BTP7_ARAVE|nr:hypothetical protein AVEN_83981-1 [Araneus ventricosus]